MALAKFFEEIKEKHLELMSLVEGIHKGEFPYENEQRKRVLDFRDAITQLIHKAEETWNHIGPDDQLIIDEKLELEREVRRLGKKIIELESQLKNAELMNFKIREEKDEANNKFRFVIETYRKHGVAELIKYLNRLH